MAMAKGARSRVRSDADRFRALAHPLRLRILEVVRTLGPVTATAVGREVGESAANCSFHLRVLADGGFVEPAEAGDGRQHPWQASSTGLTIDPLDVSPSERTAAREAVEILRDGDRRLLLAWDEARPDAPWPWKQAGFERSIRVRLTAEQLGELGRVWDAAIEEVMRAAPANDAEAEMVQLQMVGFPTRSAW